MEEEIIGTTGPGVDILKDKLTQEEWNALCVVHRMTNRLNIGLSFKFEKSVDISFENGFQIVDESVFLEKEYHKVKDKVFDGYRTDFDKLNETELRLLWEQIQQLNLEQGLKQETLDDSVNAIADAIRKRQAPNGVLTACQMEVNGKCNHPACPSQTEDDCSLPHWSDKLI